MWPLGFHILGHNRFLFYVNTDMLVNTCNMFTPIIETFFSKQLVYHVFFVQRYHLQTELSMAVRYYCLHGKDSPRPSLPPFLIFLSVAYTNCCFYVTYTPGKTLQNATAKDHKMTKETVSQGELCTVQFQHLFFLVLSSHALMLFQKKQVLPKLELEYS